MHSDSPVSSRDFLACLLPNQHAIRNFIYSIHPVAGDLDDIMQDIAVSLWEKFDTFDHDRKFLPWAMRLAYFEVLRFRKKRSRELLVFSPELVDVLAAESSDTVISEAAHLALDSCLCRLDPRSRALIEARYGRGTSITQLATTRQESVHRLYRMLERVRSMLVSCVHQKLASEGHHLG